MHSRKADNKSKYGTKYTKEEYDTIVLRVIYRILKMEKLIDICNETISKIECKVYAIERSLKCIVYVDDMDTISIKELNTLLRKHTKLREEIFINNIRINEYTKLREFLYSSIENGLEIRELRKYKYYGNMNGELVDKCIQIVKMLQKK